MKLLSGLLLLSLWAANGEETKIRGTKDVSDEPFLVLPKGTKVRTPVDKIRLIKFGSNSSFAAF